MKACNNYQMKKSAIIQMLKDEGRDIDLAYIEALIKDTSLYPAPADEDASWGIGCYEKNGTFYILDYKDQHH